ncbi:hypothetical protein ABZX93_35095 [Streptomyces sp. NPDC006632]|uniref:hypothetical protein n=1 Tax=Streptomyces sp. NPDC006632 TaxID=3157182 RepID=UPI00339E0905
MYSLSPGFRVPALQRGLSPAESLLTKLNLGVGGAVLMSAAISPPPAWAFGAVGVGAALLNVAPGPRSIARWAGVGYRRIREATAPASMVKPKGETVTWELYPQQGTMHDGVRRMAFHAAVSRALTFASTQARTAGIQIHVTHHAVMGDCTTHTQTVSVHVPKALSAQPARILGTLQGEFAALGDLIPIEPDPIPDVTEQGPGWVLLDDGRYASTARITGWPADTDGTLIPQLLLGPDTTTGTDQSVIPERSFAVLYRPLTLRTSRRSTVLQDAANGAFKTGIEKEQFAAESSARRDAMVLGDALVDLDAYITVWGHSPDGITAARDLMSLTADRFRIGLDWLTGQQHRAHVMTSAHGASTQKGAVL